MTSKWKTASLVFAGLLIVAAIVYIFMTPYNRIAGIRIGGNLMEPPEDFGEFYESSIGQIKTGGFPPFVVNVALVPVQDAFITASRPDGGYWTERARIAPDGYIRLGDDTFAMTATEIFGDDRLTLLRIWGGPDLDREMSGGVIQGTSEPLRDWVVFYWEPR